MDADEFISQKLTSKSVLKFRLNKTIWNFIKRRVHFMDVGSNMEIINMAFTNMEIQRGKNRGGWMDEHIG